MDEMKKPGGKVIPFPGAKRPLPAVAQTISGSGNVGLVGDNNHLHLNVHVGQLSKAAPIKVQPGPQHINSAQAAEVKELVSKVVATTGRPYPFVWNTVKRECRFERYELITPETYEEVCKYLRRWIASKQPTAKQMSGDEQRKRHLMRIHAEARKRHGVLDQIRSYASGRFGTNSLAELTPGQLQEVIKEFGL